MARLKIETGTTNEILRQVAKPVRNIDKQLLKLIQNMEKTMEESNGCGIAAPQVGVSVRVAIIKLNQQTEQEVNIAVINPEIIFHSEEMEIDTEGCLSVPDYFDEVSRYREILVKFLDKKGREQSLKLTDLNARVVQHEIDHLNGVLFVDKLVEKAEAKLAAIRKKEKKLLI